MKRWLSALLALALITGIAGSALADVDLTPVKNNDLYYINVQNSGNAFVGSFVPYSVSTFDHAGAIEEHPSIAYSDIIVTDYYKDAASQRAVWRMWLEVNAPSYPGITGVTFTLDGMDYTFSGVGSPDHMKDNGTYVTEDVCIVFGSENMMFWLLYLLKCEAEEDKTAILEWTMPGVLHGTRDIPIELNGYTLLDLFLVGEAMLEISDLNMIYDTDGTVMTSSGGEAPATETDMSETPAAETVEYAAEAAVEVGETVEGAAETVEAAVEEVRETVEDAAETVEAAAEEAVEEAVEAVAETPAEAAVEEVVEDAIEDAVEEVREMIETPGSEAAEEASAALNAALQEIQTAEVPEPETAEVTAVGFTEEVQAAEVPELESVGIAPIAYNFGASDPVGHDFADTIRKIITFLAGSVGLVE